MWESIILTLAATAGNNIGKVLQKKGTLSLPPLSFKLKVIKAYTFNKPWIIGFSMDVGGAILMLNALSLAPVSVVQPVSGCGLAMLCIFSHFYLKELMNAVDWMGIVLAGIGTIAVGAGGEEQKASSIPILRLPWLVIMVVILFVILNGWLRICRCQRQEQELMKSEAVEEVIYGLESGILFGMSSVTSKLGFVLLDQGFSNMLVPFSILLSLCCSSTGFFYQTRGLKHGRAIVVSTCTTVASIVTGVLAGIFALGEQLPSELGARLMLLFGWLLIILGVILLVSSSRLAGQLAWLVGHSARSRADKNLGLNRSGSALRRDSNPSAVIHTTTLHHLLSAASKEKP
ncbi:hypothetical protein Nepgr_014214 [Nepenthes gracilis]|uniref:Probable magnesium transporter n=1 Tax=Nepenthes gracilis TaxID=150966 RepID=A0AAD3XPN0_NEPGR|nr:hypothetical protein Nepgr_014214 [Nepenthes gracilis]